MTINELERILAADYPDLSTDEISDLIDEINRKKEEEMAKTVPNKMYWVEMMFDGKWTFCGKYKTKNEAMDKIRRLYDNGIDARECDPKW